MKLILKALLVFGTLYFVVVGVAAYYFVNASSQLEYYEKLLSKAFKQTVTVEHINTSFNGLNPQLELINIEVKLNDKTFAAKSLAFEASLFSVLTLSPVFEEFSLEQLYLKIESLAGGGLKVAGIKLPQKSNKTRLKKIITWLLQHKKAVSHNGQVDWFRANGEIHSYKKISSVYSLVNENRKLAMRTESYKGNLQFQALTNGDVLSDSNWDASLQIVGKQGQQLIAPQDLSANVEDGEGRIQLRHLSVEKVRDFVQLVGLGDSAKWLIQSELNGQLSDIKFDFKGPLLDFTDWHLSAKAKDVAFQSVGLAPSMNHLSGDLAASAQGGEFDFLATNADFSWSRWLSGVFPIEQANGKFRWSTQSNGNIHLELSKGQFKDSAVNLNELTASIDLKQLDQDVDTVGEIFTIGSLKTLAYRDGRLVNKQQDSALTQPLFLDAYTKFEISDVNQIERYIPKTLTPKFRVWWKNAMLEGQASNGVFSYQGEVNRHAVKEGNAQFKVAADLDKVLVDYGYGKGWPRVLNGKGVIKIENDQIDIQPEHVLLEKNSINLALLRIRDLFNKSRYLEVEGGIDVSLVEVSEFLFNGPLIKNKSSDFPVAATQGEVNAHMKITVPLGNVRETKVKGQATVKNGQIRLPEGVFVNNISGDISYTERSAESQNLRARLLGGAVSAKLITTQQAQPPTLKIEAQGHGQVSKLKPWLGAHILSLIDGEADWQADINIDNDKVNINSRSRLQGVKVNAPLPLAKAYDASEIFELNMQTGGNKVPQQLSFTYGDDLRGEFQGDVRNGNSFFDKGVIALESGVNRHYKPLNRYKSGINFLVNVPKINLDDWLDSIIELAELETQGTDTSFLDAMRTVELYSDNPILLGRYCPRLKVSAISVDGANWIGTLEGDHIRGTLQAEPRSTPGLYRFNLSKLVLPKEVDPMTPPEEIDSLAIPADFPIVEVSVNDLVLGKRKLGRLEIAGAPVGDEWQLNKFTLTRNSITTEASGQWRNNAELGSSSSFEVKTRFNQAGDVLGDMDFAGVMKKGKGRLNAKIHWRGGPHEFDFSRLNGDFDFKVEKGELLQVESSAGKLIGLFNFNSIFRRLTLDFSDVFSKGLKFDKIRFNGLLADGQAIFQEAYLYSPAAFVQVEGTVGLDKEDIDLEIHATPELGGNLTLISALANPAAGAVVFLTQKLFQSELRSSSYSSYQLKGSWKDAELKDIK